MKKAKSNPRPPAIAYKSPETPTLLPRPFKPQPKLVLVLSLLYVLWIAFLIVMRITTIHHTN